MTQDSKGHRLNATLDFTAATTCLSQIGLKLILTRNTICLGFFFEGRYSYLLIVSRGRQVSLEEEVRRREGEAKLSLSCKTNRSLFSPSRRLRSVLKKCSDGAAESAFLHFFFSQRADHTSEKSNIWKIRFKRNQSSRVLNINDIYRCVT